MVPVWLKGRKATWWQLQGGLTCLSTNASSWTRQPVRRLCGMPQTLAASSAQAPHARSPREVPATASFIASPAAELIALVRCCSARDTKLGGGGQGWGGGGVSRRRLRLAWPGNYARTTLRQGWQHTPWACPSPANHPLPPLRKAVHVRLRLLDRPHPRHQQVDPAAAATAAAEAQPLVVQRPRCSERALAPADTAPQGGEGDSSR